LLDSAEATPATATLERASAKQKGVQWVGIVPLLSGQEVRGLTVFLSMKGERSWNYEQVPQLQILGDIFYQAVLRKRAFEEVQETERRFALVADNAPMLIWMADTDKSCTYVNRRWLDFMGDTLEQELGEGWTANVHPEDRARCVQDYEEAFDARKEIRMEYRVQRRDGEYRWIMDYGVPRYSPAGAFCGYIGSSLDITDLKRSEEELGKVSGRLIHAQEEERRRIARELHDDFTQRLAALGMELAQLGQETPSKESLQQRLAEVGGKLRDITMGLSATAHQLHSSHLELIGLAASAQRLCSDFSQQNGIHVDFQQHDIPKNLPPETVLCLFRVLQEALHNVARHSHANSCRVQLRKENRGVLLTVSDAGAGFDPVRGERNGGIGLISMRERVRLVGGELHLHSRPEEGTRLEARVPMPAEPQMIGEHGASEAEPQSA
jgi:PAS domain S-box-containing protein